MKLPNAHLAVVEWESRADYLLNPAHPDNGWQGRVPCFAGVPQGGLASIGRSFPTVGRDLGCPMKCFGGMDSPHGQKYILGGRITGPSGKTALVRAIWITYLGQERPRLMTAYPKPE